MAGLLTHVGAGILGALVIYFVFYKSKPKTKIIYGIVFVIANMLPDLIDFGILSIKTGSLSPDEIMTHKLFHALAVLGHTYMNWVIVGLVVLVIGFLLYKLKKISWDGFVGVVVSIVLALIGIAIHLRLDILIQETSHWI